jgi:hypothetical protein
MRSRGYKMENPTPENNTKRNTIIIVVVAVIIICCLCAGLAGAGGGAALILPAWSRVISRSVQVTIVPVIPSISTVTAAPVDTAIPEETVTPENLLLPTETPQAQIPADQAGLGASRDEMEQFLGAGGSITFADPTTIQGFEAVMGTSSWICIQTNCAAVTLLGPADNLLAVSVVVPTDPNDPGQTGIACALLMTVASRFSQSGSGLALQILTDITQAQASTTALNKTVNDNGYEFTIMYDPQTHNAGLAVSRPKQ